MLKLTGGIATTVIKNNTRISGQLMDPFLKGLQMINIGFDWTHRH